MRALPGKSTSMVMGRDVKAKPAPAGKVVKMGGVAFAVVDLLLIVENHGGAAAVTEQKLWKSIARELGVNTNVVHNASTRLRVLHDALINRLRAASGCTVASEGSEPAAESQQSRRRAAVPRFVTTLEERSANTGGKHTVTRQSRGRTAARKVGPVCVVRYTGTSVYIARTGRSRAASVKPLGDAQTDSLQFSRLCLEAEADAQRIRAEAQARASQILALAEAAKKASAEAVPSANTARRSPRRRAATETAVVETDAVQVQAKIAAPLEAPLAAVAVANKADASVKGRKGGTKKAKGGTTKGLQKGLESISSAVALPDEVQDDVDELKRRERQFSIGPCRNWDANSPSDAFQDPFDIRVSEYLSEVGVGKQNLDKVLEAYPQLQHLSVIQNLRPTIRS
jgi:hypothetical protein